MGKKALIVENENSLVNDIRRLLLDPRYGLGFTACDIAATGEVAVSKLEDALSKGEQYDLFMLDNQLDSAMSGWQVAERIRASDSSTPILFYTTDLSHAAYSMPPVERFAPAKLLVKPANNQDIINVIKELLNKQATPQ